MAKTPFNQECEAGLLGAILLDPTRCMYIASKNSVTAESFYQPAHGIIFTAMQACMTKRGAVDVVLVAEELQGRRELDNVGGRIVIDNLVDACVTSSHAEHYCEIVKRDERTRAALQLIKAAKQSIESGDDGDGAVDRLQSELMALGTAGDMEIKQFGHALETVRERWLKARESGVVGVPCHIAGINRNLGGWRNGILGVVGGYRGEGKSTWVRGDALWNAMQGRKVAMFLLEDPGEIAEASMAGSISGHSTHNLDIGDSTEKQIDAICSTWESLKNIPLWYIDRQMTMTQIVTAAELLHARHGLDIIYIDHIQLISPIQMRNMSRNDTISQYTAALAGLAKRLELPVICASQFSRGAEKADREPRLSDLRDSGSIEQDARQVLLLSYDGDAGSHVMRIAKNNYGKSGDRIPMRRIDGEQRFEEIAQSYGDPI